MRGEWVESFRRPVSSGNDGFGRHAWGVADVRAHGDTHVIPDASRLADRRAFHGRYAFRHRHGFREPEELPDEHEFWDA